MRFIIYLAVLLLPAMSFAQRGGGGGDGSGGTPASRVSVEHEGRQKNLQEVINVIAPASTVALNNLTATASEINQALDGISTNVTVANLNTLTGGGATTLHTHAVGDATTLDGIDSLSFFRSDADDTMTGAATFNGAVTLGDAAGDVITINGTSTFATTVNFDGTTDFDGGIGNGDDVAINLVDFDVDANGQVLVGTGTTGGYAFQADTDTGIFRSGADAYDLYAGNTSQIAVATTGITVANAFAVNGNTTLGNASTDTVTINAAPTFNTTTTYTLAATENIAITNTPGTNAVDLISATLTNNDGGASAQRILALTNADSTSTTEAAILIDNADGSAGSLTDAIRITSTGVASGIADAIDVSADNIDNAINIGANNIVTSVATISSAELDQLDAVTDLVDADDAESIDGVFTFNTDSNFTLAGTENVAITNTPGSNAVDLISATLTNNDGGASAQRILALTNADSTSTTEAAIFIDNADATAGSLADGVLITSTGVNAGITDAIDVSADNINNAINVGANDIEGTTATITFTDFTVTADGLTSILPDGGGTGLTITQGTGAGTRGVMIDPSVSLTDGIRISPTGGTIDSGLTIIENGGTVTTAIDLSQSAFTAINVGSNTITGTDFTISATAGDVAISGTDWGVTSGGLITAGSGSNSTPGYGFDADTNTGMYSVSGDLLGFTSGGDSILQISGGATDGIYSMIAGSAAAPAYAFKDSNGGVDTGIYFVDNGANDIDIALTADGVVRLYIDESTGRIGIGNGADTTPEYALDVTGKIEMAVANAGSGTTLGMCTSAVDQQAFIDDCNGAPGDIAEWYETKEGIESGDLVTTSNQLLSYQGDKPNSAKGRLDKFYYPIRGSIQQISILEKTTASYQENVIGVISTMPFQLFGEDVKNAWDAKNPQPVALAGRVPVKVNGEGGPIYPGDRITTSSTPGVGMKATKPGPVIGIALASHTVPEMGKVMIYMTKHSYVTPKAYEVLDEISGPEASETLKNLVKSGGISEIINDKASLQNLKEVIKLYAGSPARAALENILNLTPGEINKLALLSQHILGARGNGEGALSSLDGLTDEELEKLIDKVFFVEGTLVVQGELVKVEETSDHKQVATHMPTAMRPYLYDRGEAKLVNGVATVELDPRFLDLVYMSEDQPLQVQITPTSVDIQGALVVSSRTKTHFMVEEVVGGKAGNSNTTFSWEVSALRRAAPAEKTPEMGLYLRSFLEK